jgi:hypothetical protein
VGGWVTPSDNQFHNSSYLLLLGLELILSSDYERCFNMPQAVLLVFCFAFGIMSLPAPTCLSEDSLLELDSSESESDLSSELEPASAK